MKLSCKNKLPTLLMTDDVSMEKPKYIDKHVNSKLSVLFKPTFDDIERFRLSLDEIVKL